MRRVIFLSLLVAFLAACGNTPPPKSNPPRQPADPPPSVCVDPEIKKCAPE